MNRAGLWVSGGGWGVRGPHAWQIVMKEVRVIHQGGSRAKGRVPVPSITVVFSSVTEPLTGGHLFKSLCPIGAVVNLGLNSDWTRN